MSTNTKSKVQLALERGEIPDRIREGYRVITAGDEARTFQRDMEVMARQILGDKEYDELGGIRFYLTDEPFKNAGKFNFARPPMIVFTRELIDSLKEENLQKVAETFRKGVKTTWGEVKIPPTEVPDEFAKNGKGMLMGILAHELEHIHRGDQNSKGIEVECDKFAVKKLIELGYREQSLNEALQFLLSGEGEHERNIAYDLRQYLDVHPKTDNRIRMMDNEFYRQIWHETSFQKDDQKRRIKPDAQGLPEAFIANAANAPYESPIDKLLLARDYEHQSPGDKIRILHDIIKKEAPKWDKEQHEPRQEELIEHLGKVIKNSKHKPEESEVKQALDALVDTLLGVGNPNPEEKWYNLRLFDNIARDWHGTYNNSTEAVRKPFGTHEKLAQSIEKFINAESRDVAMAAAREAEDLITRYHVSEHAKSANVTLLMPEFYGASEYDLLAVEKRIHSKTGKHPALEKISDEDAKQHGIKPKWHEHVNWALQEKGGDQPIRRMLQRLSVDEKSDPRLPPYTDPNIKAVISAPMSVIFAPNGYLVGVNPSTGYVRDDRWGRSGMLAERSKLITEIKKSAPQDMSKVDWSPIRNRDSDAASKFCDKYATELSPDVKTQKPPGEFEKQFVKELEEALRKPKRYDCIGGDRFILTMQQFFKRMARNIADQAGAYEAKDVFIDPNHPYAQLILRNTYGFMKRFEQAEILEQVIPSQFRHKEASLDGYNPKMPEYLEQNISFFRSAFSFKPAGNVNELFALYEHLDCDRKEEYRDHYNGLLLKDLAELETLRFIKAHPEAQFTTNQLVTLYELGKDELGGLKPAFEDALGNYVEKHSAKELKLGAGELIQVYNLHQRSQLFKHRADLRDLYESTIMEKVNQITDPRKKERMVESLLLRDQQAPDITAYFVYKRKNKDKDKEEQPAKFLNNPEFRKWAIDNWVELCTARTAQVAANNIRVGAHNGRGQGYGYDSTPKVDDYEARALNVEKNPVDDGSKEYYRVGEGTANRVIEGTDGVTRHTMLTQYLHATQAQEKLSFHVRDELKKKGDNDIAEMHLQASAGEAFLDHLASDPTLRVATIEFLRAPLTKESSKNYSDQLRESAKRAEGAYSNEFPKLRDQIKTARQRAELYDRNQRVSIHAAEMLHKNFTNATTEYRTFLMEKVLFPPNSNAKPMSVPPQQYVFDAVLPENDEFAKYGRTLFTNYLGGLTKEEEYVRRIYLSAMLVAEDPGAKEPDAKKRVGKAIHTLLSTMDNPLATKLSQAIDSSKVPDWLRNPASKISTNIPPRWEIWEMYNKDAPQQVKETTTRMGKVRAGAIGIAVELEKDTEKMAAAGYAPDHITPRTVLKILRKGAAEKVHLHAPLATRMIEESIKEFPELSKSRPILAHAIHSGQLETDFTNAPVQTEIASRSVNGIKITIGGESYTLHEIPIIRANKQSHEMTFAHGTVFNELSKAQKGKVAHVLDTAENYLQLLGQQVDWDRHGAQVIVNGNDIYLLDRGGMAIHPPSEDDKKLLGGVIAQAINDYRINKVPFSDAIVDAIDRTADPSGHLNHYLATIARGQHNLGDIRRELTDEQKLQSMLAVLNAGQVDPTIKKTVIQNITVMHRTLDWLGTSVKTWVVDRAVRKSNANNPISIEDPNIETRKQPLDVDEIKRRSIVEDDEVPGTRWRQLHPQRDTDDKAARRSTTKPKPPPESRRNSLVEAGAERY